MCVIFRSIIPANNIILFKVITCCVCTIKNGILMNCSFLRIKVCYGILLIEHRVIDYLIAIAIRRKHTANFSPYFSNIQSISSISYRIIRICGPSFENHTFIKIKFAAWIIKNSLHVISRFDIHGVNFCFTVHELHKRSGILSSLYYNID